MIFVIFSFVTIMHGSASADNFRTVTFFNSRTEPGWMDCIVFTLPKHTHAHTSRERYTRMRNE
jgi:uncharacterized protein YfdQ (DUF2303 family)